MAKCSAYVPLWGPRGALRNAYCAVTRVPARFIGPLGLNLPTQLRPLDDGGVDDQ